MYLDLYVEATANRTYGWSGRVFRRDLGRDSAGITIRLRKKYHLRGRGSSIAITEGGYMVVGHQSLGKIFKVSSTIVQCTSFPCAARSSRRNRGTGNGVSAIPQGFSLEINLQIASDRLVPIQRYSHRCGFPFWILFSCPSFWFRSLPTLRKPAAHGRRRCEGCHP